MHFSFFLFEFCHYLQFLFHLVPFRLLLVYSSLKCIQFKRSFLKIIIGRVLEVLAIQEPDYRPKYFSTFNSV